MFEGARDSVVNQEWIGCIDDLMILRAKFGNDDQSNQLLARSIFEVSFKSSSEFSQERFKVAWRELYVMLKNGQKFILDQTSRILFRELSTEKFLEAHFLRNSFNIRPKFFLSYYNILINSVLPVVKVDSLYNHIKVLSGLNSDLEEFKGNTSLTPGLPDPRTPSQAVIRWNIFCRKVGKFKNSRLESLLQGKYGLLRMINRENAKRELEEGDLTA